MAHLHPFPFGRLLSRVMRELEGPGPVLDLPRAKVVTGPGARSWDVFMHGRHAATPLGPAAGPHTQLAQNIVLSYLGGCRIFELKTVQIQDELQIPRPCIDLRTVGFNVEWSQELKLEQSLEEYVKASMLLEVLGASGLLGLSPGFEPFVFDMSVGYDLKGVQTERVRAFLSGMLDAKAVVDRLRKEIPEPWKRFRDLDFRTRISDAVTLSTFHGCPPGEIEGICRFLMDEVGVHCVVKLNPTLLGPTEARRLFHDVLGYRYRIPDSAFANDPTFDQAMELVGRLEGAAHSAGKSLGVKFSNTLVVENDAGFLPKSEALAYLSGQPLHVLAMTLVGKFRGVFEDRLPVSFSAGIDKQNFPDAVGLGLVPVTVCSDLLRTGGYGRLQGYFQELGARMDAVHARTVDELVLKGQGQAEAALARVPGADVEACKAALQDGGDVRAAAKDTWPRWLSEARLLNTQAYVKALHADPRYAAAANQKAPRKVGSTLWLFDCLTCDKCVPVCPNHANFTYPLPPATLPVVKLRQGTDGAWVRETAAPLEVKQKHQLANYADFCNECGNCDVFCPEDGGPYVLKPRFFGSPESWARTPLQDGVWVLKDGPTRGRFKGQEYALSPAGGGWRFEGPGFGLELDDAAPDAAPKGRVDAGVTVDLTYFHILRWLRGAVLAGPLNYISA